MNIDELLKKNYWVRRTAPGSTALFAPAGNNDHYIQPMVGTPGVGYRNLTQQDFLNELYPAAHVINTDLYSKRPIYKQTGEKDEQGKAKWVFDGYDDVETVAVALQEFIISKKISHLTGNGFWMANETDDGEAFDNLKSWGDIVGLMDAYAEAVKYCERTGDSALYLYQVGDTIEYEVFAFEKGDTLYPSRDEKGRPMLCRQYSLNGKMAVDIFTTESISTWVKVDKESDEDKNWLRDVKRWIQKLIPSGDKSEDGWTRIASHDAQIGSDMLQIIYFRVDDIATGPVQETIESYERGLSYVSEEVKNSAFPIMFVKAEKMTSLPPTEAHGKTIGVKGSADSLAHADAKILNPGDASNIAELNLNTMLDNILRGSMTTVVEPDLLRAGADSGQAIQLLFTPDSQWCMSRWSFYAKPVRQIVEVFKRLVGKVEGEIERYGKLRISCGLDVWLPKNEAERVDMVTARVYARILSRKAAIQELGNQYRGDFEQIQKEWEDEIRMKAEIPAEAEAKYGTAGTTVREDDNPNTPAISITNQAAGKTISKGFN